MFCHKCGAQIQSISKFCNRCGDSVINNDQLHQDLKCTTKVSSTKHEEYLANNSPRPWVRFWARFIDVNIYSVFLVLFIAVFPDLLYINENTNKNSLAMLVLLCGSFIEPIILTMFGTTAGKWLLRIRLVKGDNSKASFIEYLKRSLTIYFFGWCMGLPIFMFFTLTESFFSLKNNKITKWDKAGNFVVTHGEIGLLRLVVSTLVIVGFAVLNLSSLYA